MDTLDRLFIATSFAISLALIAHFAVRKWRFETALKHGWWVYLLGLPAAVVSLALLLAGKAWYFWLGGFLYLAWAVFGLVVEYGLKIEWRSPIRPAVFVPYIALYLAMQMFYWFPLARLARPLVYVYAALYILATWLNVTSHQKNVLSNEVK